MNDNRENATEERGVRCGIRLVCAAVLAVAVLLALSPATGGEREKTVGGIIFVYIPGGSFMMGSPKGTGEEEEHPRHRVRLDGFWMGKYEVTQAQYQAVMGTNPSSFKGGDRPVESVNWNDAVEFCRRFNGQYGVGARLPTEAEWEYACRAGTRTRFYWGDEVNDDYCWYAGNSNMETSPVGTKKPNTWGLYDMSGNVLEWCLDWYDENYYKGSPERNPIGPQQGRFRVIRGGCWDNGVDDFVRSGFRHYCPPTIGGNGSGFRCVLPAP